MMHPSFSSQKNHFFGAVLKPIQNWLDQLEVRDRTLAQLITRIIPSQCPFERDLIVAGRKIAHIPPLCKLNPLYDQLVGLRFRSLCFLAEQGVEL
jgi:hypothetical protein